MRRGRPPSPITRCLSLATFTNHHTPVRAAWEMEHGPDNPWSPALATVSIRDTGPVAPVPSQRSTPAAPRLVAYLNTVWIYATSFSHPSCAYAGARVPIAVPAFPLDGQGTRSLCASVVVAEASRTYIQDRLYRSSELGSSNGVRRSLGTTSSLSAIESAPPPRCAYHQ
ncbi:hypothetical protein F5B20DRAFT_583528 [Whalleya microplaca]|nr:hypothetical protein F5B20DRAFT_583528 [Whalleya microplaca]